MKTLLCLTLWLAALPQAPAEFCAYYTRIDSGEPFEEYSRTGPEADIVVRDIGPDKGRFVFWRGSSYLPYFEAKGGKWFVPELTERKGDGPPGRPDKVNTYSVARIIESSPGKVVIHWRYLPRFEGTNPHYNAVNLPEQLEKPGGKPPAHLVDPTRFVDEYFTITPDGKVTRTFKPGTAKYSGWLAPGNHMVQELGLTVNGIAVGSTKAPAAPAPAKPVSGRAINDKVVVQPVNSFDGLIDEVKIYNLAITPEQVAASCALMELPDTARAKPDLDRRVLPAGLKTGKFGAYYTHLPFYDTWEGMFRFSDHPDVVVEFDQQPTSFVFWRGVGFITMMVNESGQWYSNEFNETWARSGGKGCQEPMSDKEAFSNHAKILENTPARAVVQWRYPLVDVFHTIANYDDDTGWGDWSDWTYTIYPDGVAAKNMRLWSSGPINHEWQEGMVITGPDQHPEQVVETDPALVLATLTGETREYSWKNGPPRGVDYRDVKVHVINFTGEYDPFTIGDFQKGNVYGGEVTDYSVFPSWNHWPVAQMPSDGRYARHPDRTAHSSLTHVVPAVHRHQEGRRPYQERLLLEGMTRKTPAELATLARSWLHPPAIKALAGCIADDYNPAKRDYTLRATDKTMSVTIDASKERPLANVCFCVRNWGPGDAANVLMDGMAPGGVRQGTFVDTDGTRTMVIWIEVASSAPATFTISGANPAQ